MRRISAAHLILLLTGGAPMVLADSTPNLEHALIEARELIDLGLPTIAAQRLDSILEDLPPSEPGAGEAYLLLGEARNDLASPRAALDALRLARVGGGYDPRRLKEEGISHALMGNYGSALERLTAARRAAERADDARTGAAVLTDLALLYLRLGNTGEALARIDEAVEITGELGLPRDAGYALSARGQILSSMEDPVPAGGRAEDAFADAAELFDEAGDARGSSIARANLAVLLLRSGELVRSRSLFETLAREHEEMGDLSSMATDLLHLAVIDRREGAPAAALARLDEALRLFMEAPFPEGTRRAFENRAIIERETGNTGGAINDLERAVAVLEDLASTAPVPDQASFMSRHFRTYERLIDLLIDAGRSGEALDYMERARARTFLEIVHSAEIDPWRVSDAELVARERELLARLGEARSRTAETRRALAVNLTTRGEYNSAQGEVSRIEEEYSLLLSEASQENLSGLELVRVPIPDLGIISSRLDPGEAIIEYMLGTSRSVAWIVKGDGIEAVRIDASRSEIAGLVNEFLGEIERGAGLDALAGRRLHALLIDPIDDLLPRGGRLIISPHGPLHYLPWAALSDGESYLAEDYMISIRSRGEPPEGPSSAGGLLAMGGPESDLAPLPFALREVEEISEIVPGTLVLTGRDASEAAFLEHAPAAGAIHLACHGTLSPSAPLFSALHLAPGEGSDGRIEVREAFSIPLSSDLVVLSGCMTALGPLSEGDEIIGLVRAFRYSGAKRVVASLWEVGDRSTAELMTHFYRGIKAGLSPSEAMAEAERIMIRHPYSSRFRSPAAWAPFQIYG